MSIIKRFKDYLSNHNNSFRLDNLEVGGSIKFKSITDLAPFNLKIMSRGKGGYDPINQAISDLPELKDMIFQIDIDLNTIKRIK